MEFSRFFRSLTDISRNLISIEFGGISKLVKSSKFLKQGVDINKNLKLINLSRFPRF